MPSKEQFLTEIDSQLKEMQAVITQTGASITNNHVAIGELQAQRQQRIRAYVLSLLSDLKPANIEALTQKVPGMVTVTGIQQLVADRELTFKRQLERFKAGIDPRVMASSKEQLEGALAEAENDMATTKEAYGDLLESDTSRDIERLVKAGYGTSDYKPRWWQFDGQYYRDWQLSDRLVENAKAKSWKDLATRHETQNTMRDLLQVAVQNLATFNGVQARLAELSAQVTSAGDGVLDQLRVQLASRLDCMDPVPTWMSDVQNLFSRINTLQQENAKLQDTRTTISKQSVELQSIRERATRSRKNEVPDQYLKALRASRPVQSTFDRLRSVPMTTSAPTYVTHDDGSFYNGLLMGQMLGYFDHQEPRHEARNFAADLQQPTYTPPMVEDRSQPQPVLETARDTSREY